MASPAGPPDQPDPDQPDQPARSGPARDGAVPGAGTLGAGPLGAGVLAAVVFLALAVAVAIRWPPLAALDVAVELPAHRLVTSSPGLLAATQVVTALGSPVAMNLVTTIAVGWLLLARRARPAVYLVLARLLELGVETLAKELVDRPRPVWPDPVAFGTNTSFPSGHSAGTAVVVAGLLLLGVRSIGRPTSTPARAGVLAGTVAGVALFVLVPVSRVLLGVHYPADVTAGLALGLACALTLAPLLTAGTTLTVPRRRDASSPASPVEHP